MKYKAVVFDLDGTAVDSPTHKQASPRLKQAVRTLSEKGVRLCAATGRPESFAEPVLTSLGLHDPAIVAAGTRIVDPSNGIELWRCNMTESQVRNVVDALSDIQYGVLWNEFNEADYSNKGWNLEQFRDYENTYYINVCFIPSDEALAVVSRVTSIEGLAVILVESQTQGSKDIHITSRAATKEHAIYELEKILGVDKGTMIGVGDGHNDLHLFNAVGHKVAMGNAVDELKECADEVIGSVKEDGLALYFEKLAKEEL